MGNLQFAVSSESEHVTSSAHHSQSNGKVLWKHLSRMQKKKKTYRGSTKWQQTMQISNGQKICTHRNNNTQIAVIPNTIWCGDNAAAHQMRHHKWRNHRSCDKFTKTGKGKEEDLDLEHWTKHSETLHKCWIEITKYVFGNNFRRNMGETRYATGFGSSL